MSASDQLLVVIDPSARRCDGESVRIAKDVLSAGAAVKLCVPDGPAEFARALARRGARRLVVVGDDRALLRVVALLHRERELDHCTLSLVPVGAALSLAYSLGVPLGAVAAARAVLDGAERRLDLLVDDSDGVVLGQLHIPSLPGARPDGGPRGDAGRGGPGGRVGPGGLWTRGRGADGRRPAGRRSRGSGVDDYDYDGSYGSPGYGPGDHGWDRDRPADRPDRNRPDRNGQDRNAQDRNAQGWNERGWNERGWNERGWNERGWNERGWNERGWDGYGWDGSLRGTPGEAPGGAPVGGDADGTEGDGAHGVGHPGRPGRGGSPGRDTGPDDGTGEHRHSWLDHCHALVRALASRPLGGAAAPVLPWGRGAAADAPARLRVEADGVLLADLDEPVRGIRVVPCDNGLARVEVLPTATDTKAVPLRARARTVTVSGPDFRYRADSLTAGPVRTRTWTTHADAWALTLPVPSSATA